MVGTIGPLVKEARERWLTGIGLLIVGGMVGGAIAGVGISIAGALVLKALGLEARDLFALLTLVGVVTTARDAGLLRIDGPPFRRSVPKSWWYSHGPWRATLTYGFVLGLGVTTTVPMASYYWLLIWIAVSGTPAYGAITLAMYGVGRAVPVIAASPFMAFGHRTETVLFWLQARRRMWDYVAAMAVLMWVANAALLSAGM